MESYQSPVAIESSMQGGNIAEAQKDFGMPADHIIIQHGQKPGRTIAAADAENGVHRIIGKKAIDIPGTDFIRSCQMPMPGYAAFPYYDFIAQPFPEGLGSCARSWL